MLCVTGLGMSTSFQFLVQSVAPCLSSFPLPARPPATCLACLCSGCLNSVIQSVSQPVSAVSSVTTTITPLILQTNPPNLAGICFAHLLVHPPSSLKTRTPTWEPSRPASLHHYIIQSFASPRTPVPTPELPIVAPVGLRPKNADTYLTCLLAWPALLSDCEACIGGHCPVRSLEVSDKVQAPSGRACARRPGCKAAAPIQSSIYS